MAPTRALAASMLALLTLSMAVPPVLAAHEYVEPVWFRWNSAQLDILVLGTNVNPPKQAIAAWQAGIDQLAPDWLRDNLTMRVYHPAADPVPPLGYQASDIEIVIVPMGFFATAPVGLNGGTCFATAPITSYTTIAHEFGHCLGLGHVFQHGDEYSPSFDLMGSGADYEGQRSCPSNLNIQVLERVYGHLSGMPSGGSVTMPSAEYTQADC